MREHGITEFDFAQTAAVDNLTVDFRFTETSYQPAVAAVVDKLRLAALKAAGIIKSQRIVYLLLNIRIFVVDISFDGETRPPLRRLIARVVRIVGMRQILSVKNPQLNRIALNISQFNRRNGNRGSGNALRNQTNLPLALLRNLTVDDIGLIGIGYRINGKILIQNAQLRHRRIAAVIIQRQQKSLALRQIGTTGFGNQRLSKSFGIKKYAENQNADNLPHIFHSLYLFLRYSF